MTAEMFIMELFAELERGLMGPDAQAIATGLGVLIMATAGILALVLLFSLIKLIARWKIFTKAGEKGYKVLIPFYGTYTEFAFTWKGSLYLLMIALTAAGTLVTTNYPEGLLYTFGSLISLAGAVMVLIQRHKLSRSFGHSFAFTLGLFFLEPVFLLILAFGKSRYVGAGE